MCALGVQLPHERSKNLQIQVILGLSSGADLWQRRAQSAPISLESGSVVSRLPETDGLCIQSGHPETHPGDATTTAPLGGPMQMEPAAFGLEHPLAAPFE